MNWILKLKQISYCIQIHDCIYSYRAVSSRCACSAGSLHPCSTLRCVCGRGLLYLNILIVDYILCYDIMATSIQGASLYIAPMESRNAQHANNELFFKFLWSYPKHVSGINQRIVYAGLHNIIGEECIIWLYTCIYTSCGRLVLH